MSFGLQRIRFRVEWALRSPWLRPWRVVQAAKGSRRPPDFLIIGAQKAGTTTLYDLLLQHPMVAGALRKEVQFFTSARPGSIATYLAEFPSQSDPRLGGEATPFYLFHPTVPAQVARVAPAARVIALLREPVARAVSHYEHERRLGCEPRSLDQALDAEADILAQGTWDQPHLPRAMEWARRHQSYVGRGLYARQLSRWLEFVSSDRMLLLQSEAFFADPTTTANQVFAFLGLPPHQVNAARILNAGRYQPPPSAVHSRLRAMFLNDVAALRTMVPFPVWDY